MLSLPAHPPGPPSPLPKAHHGHSNSHLLVLVKTTEAFCSSLRKTTAFTAENNMKKQTLLPSFFCQHDSSNNRSREQLNWRSTRPDVGPESARSRPVWAAPSSRLQLFSLASTEAWMVLCQRQHTAQVTHTDTLSDNKTNR